MKVRYALIVAAALLPFLLPPTAVSHEKASASDTLTIYIENDAFGFENNDRHYTNGLKLSWISRDLTSYRDVKSLPAWMHRVIERVPYINDPDRLRTLSVSIGQNIYTPEDAERTDLIVDDRPYAGITYLGVGLHGRSRHSMDTLELGIGVVGPDSYAEDCQIMFHKWIKNTKPKGWEHQLHNEPIVNLFYERKWRTRQIRKPEGFGFDIIPHLGLAVGNAYTGANVGTQLRIGWNIPNDFGTFLIRPGSDSSAPYDNDDPRFFQPRKRFGIHIFFAADGRIVLRDILLDGNTFRDSHSVKKEPFVADFIGGAGLIIHRVKITFSLVYRTKEFETQRKEQQFGSIAVSYTF
jgi:hypothetical protein